MHVLTFDDHGAIRRARPDGMSIRRIAHEFDHARYEVRQVSQRADPETYPQTSNRQALILGPMHAITNQVLADDADAHCKQRHRERFSQTPKAILSDTQRAILSGTQRAILSGTQDSFFRHPCSASATQSFFQTPTFFEIPMFCVGNPAIVSDTRAIVSDTRVLREAIGAILSDTHVLRGSVPSDALVLVLADTPELFFRHPSSA